MDLNYDYGDVVHTHKHIHTKPDSHRQVVEHALKEWCHDYFGEEIAEAECSELNEIQHHDIMDGGHDDLKVSDIYLLIKDLQKLNGTYIDKNENPNKSFKLTFKGSKVDIEINSTSVIEKNIYIKKKEDGFFKIYIKNIDNKILDLRVDGIYIEKSDGIYLLTKEKYDETVIKNLKQTLRNLDLNKLKSEIEKSDKEVEMQKKRLKRRIHEKGDEFAVERKLEMMERTKKDRKMELIILIIFFIIGFMFGIFCIYTQFSLDL